MNIIRKIRGKIERKILNYKIKRLEKKYSKKCSTELERNILNLISSRNFEKLLVITFRVVNKIKGSYVIDDFMRNDIVIDLIKSSKYRYYEMFISLFNEKSRDEYSKILYGENYREIINARELLSMKGSEVESTNIYLTGAKEWSEIFGNDPIPIEKQTLMKKFDKEATKTDVNLFHTINKFAPEYLFRKFVTANIHDLKLFKCLCALLNKERINVLDYGCGGAEFSIIAAKNDSDVVICDIKGRYLDSVKKRFDLRGLKYTAVGATIENSIPVFYGFFDIIICREVLEHMRYPLRLLETLNTHLTKNSYIVLGTFPFVATSAVGDHLEEAVNIHRDIRLWIEKNWKRVHLLDNTYIFQKNN